MQLALFIPLFVVVYRRSAWAGHALCFFAFMFSTVLVCFFCVKYDLKAGPLAEPNWYLFSYLFQKPWNKFHTFSLAIISAYMYMGILDYRKIEDERDRKQ
jgi:hypothetical protein